MLSPKRIKYRKRQRGERNAEAHRGNSLAFVYNPVKIDKKIQHFDNLIQSF